MGRPKSQQSQADLDAKKTLQGINEQPGSVIALLTE